MQETIDVTILAAFTVGFISFISPCVLPLVPGYLSAISGVSFSQIQSGDRLLSRILWPAVIFCLAFTLVFVALGMTATGIGSILRDNRDTLDRIAGGLIIGLGIFFVLTAFIPKLNREWHPQVLLEKAGAGGPLIAGAAFALAWTPCVGPTLSAILTTAAVQTTVAKGGLLLAAYSAGMALPFLLCAFAFMKAWGMFRWLRDRYLLITGISGVILVTMGLLLLTGNLTEVNRALQGLFDSIGLDFLKSL